jgi:hypothetical protein
MTTTYDVTSGFDALAHAIADRGIEANESEVQVVLARLTARRFELGERARRLLDIANGRDEPAVARERAFGLLVATLAGKAETTITRSPRAA